MKVRARCNKRHCQARRNLSKYPEEYVRWPRCHVIGCDGKMYVDKYRMRRGARDRSAACFDACCPLGYRQHRIDNQGCSGYEDYVLGLHTKPRSKHSPIVDDPYDEAPF